MSKLLLVLLALSASFVANAEIYKWKDSHGNTIYSDKAPKANKSLNVNIVGRALTPSGVSSGTEPFMNQQEYARSNAGPEMAKVDDENEKIREKNRLAEEEFKRKEAETNRKNCENAKLNFSRFAAGGRIRMLDEKGEAYYLSEEQIATNKKNASDDVERYCTAK